MLTLGIYDGPKKDLLDLIKQTGPLSIDQLKKNVKIAKTTIRQHLVQLEEQNLISRSYDKTQPGRPKILFQLTPRGDQLYPTQEPAILREFFDYLSKNGQEKTIEVFFRSYWEKRKTRFNEILFKNGGKTDHTARVTALIQLLKEEGFMPQVRKKGGHLWSVRGSHCPFREVVRTTRLPCQLESEFLSWALKTPIQRTEYIPDGKTACSYQID